MSNIKYDIIEKIGWLSETETSWGKELNLISWNDREAKYDLRDWAPDNVKMGKGITLSKEELKALKDILNGLDLWNYKILI